MKLSCNSISIFVIAALTVSSTTAFAPLSFSSRSSSSSSSSSSSLYNYDPNTASAPPAQQQQQGQQGAGTSPLADDFLNAAPSVRRVQGDTLKTWDFTNPNTARVQVGAKGTNGRPLHSRIEYWHTPSYIPFQVTAYTEDGLQRPIDCIIETPKHPKTIAMYNTASQQMPFDAAIDDTGLISPYDAVTKTGVQSDIVQGGGMIKYYTFDSNVDSVAVYLRSPEYNMKAKLELTTGPNSVRQTYEVYCSSGYKTPFYTVIQTPGDIPSTLRIINQNSVEFPFDAYVMPYHMKGDGNNGGAGGAGDDWDQFPEPRSNIMGSW